MIVIGYESEDGEYHGLWWDAVISREYRYSSTASKYPVEGGSTVTDHILTEPITIRLEGLVTDTPVLPDDGSDPLGGGKGEGARSARAYTLLKELWQGRVLIDIFTPHDYFESFVITDVQVPHDLSHAGGLWVSVTCREVRIVESEAVAIAPKPKKQPGIDDLIKQLDKTAKMMAEKTKDFARRELKKLERKEELRNRMKKIEDTKDMEELKDLKYRWQLEDMIAEAEKV